MDATPTVEEALFRALHLAARHAAAEVERRLADAAGVSLPELEILTVLNRAPESRARAGALGAMLAWEKSRLSHQVARMEKRGLVTRDSCDDDLRGTWVLLTAEGRAAAEAAMPAYRDAVSAVVADSVSPSSAVDTTEVLRALVQRSLPAECEAAERGDDGLAGS